MRLVLLFLLALAALAPTVTAQTCGGRLSLTLGVPIPRQADSLRATPASQYEITATAVAPSMPGHRLAPHVVGRPPLDSLARRADLAVTRDTLASGWASLFWARDALSTWTRCGFALLRYTITGHDGGSLDPVMTLDLYNVPPHIGVEAGGLLPFRPGRWTFDFADGIPFTADGLRRE